MRVGACTRLRLGATTRDSPVHRRRSSARVQGEGHRRGTLRVRTEEAGAGHKQRRGVPVAHLLHLCRRLRVPLLIVGQTAALLLLLLMLMLPLPHVVPPSLALPLLPRLPELVRLRLAL